jgi:hypothetical protein
MSKELIGLSYNRNFFVMLIATSLLILGTREWDIGSLAKWKGLIIVFFGAAIYWHQIYYLIELQKPNVIKT